MKILQKKKKKKSYIKENKTEQLLKSVLLQFYENS